MPALRERIAGDTPGGRVGLGFHLLADTSAPLLAAYEAMAKVYRELAEGFTITSRPWRIGSGCGTTSTAPLGWTC